jgi:hypothetical protein
MADPPPGNRNAVSRAVRIAPPHHRGSLITEPLTVELIDELDSGGPWESDTEFAQWMEVLADARRTEAA